MNLFKAITELKTEKEAENFFRDLCTLEEIKNMRERWQIAQLLSKGGNSYREIAAKLNVSTTTVTRVANWLNYGTGGYQLILDRTSHHNSSRAIKKS